MPKLEHVVRGIKKGKANMSKPCLPSTFNIFLKLRSVCEEDATKLNHIMLWAGCCTCFFGFPEVRKISIPSDKEYDRSTYL